MLSHHLRRAAAGAEVEYATFDPLNKDANILLSGDDLIATANSTNWKGAIGTFALESGKPYFEITINNNANYVLGVSSIIDSASTYLGFSSTGYGYVNQLSNKINNNISVGVGVLANTPGDVIQVWINLDSGKIWWGLNGVPMAGDPIAGTGEMYGGLVGPKAIHASVFNVGTSCTLNSGQSPLAYPIQPGWKLGFFR